jgi:uncharacterized membrane protein
MSRRRSVPWIHRWSRPLIAAIAGLGALTTAYLTVVKLTQSSAACPTHGCDQVLASPYATIFGQPLALFGLLAYTSMTIFALAPLAVKQAENKELRSKLENITWLLLLAGAIAMAVFSGYLMYLLAFQLKAICIYCLASAIFSLSLLVLTILGRVWEDVGQILFTGIVVGMVTLVGTIGIYAKVSPTGTAGATSGQASDLSPEPVGSPTPGVGWPITTTSSEAELSLARHLKKIGAKEYIAGGVPTATSRSNCLGKKRIARSTMSIVLMVLLIRVQISVKQQIFKVFPPGRLTGKLLKEYNP